MRPLLLPLLIGAAALAQIAAASGGAAVARGSAATRDEAFIGWKGDVYVPGANGQVCALGAVEELAVQRSRGCGDLGMRGQQRSSATRANRHDAAMSRVCRRGAAHSAAAQTPPPLHTRTHTQHIHPNLAGARRPARRVMVSAWW